MATSGDERDRAGSRGVIGVAIAWLVLAAISLSLAFGVAEGEARAHATSHLFVGSVSMGLFVSVGLLWRPGEGAASMIRAGILVITAMGAFGQVLESIGASGYDRFNAGREIGFLTGIHSGVRILGPVALMAIPIGLVALLLVVIARMVRRASATRAG